jgi:hypothetical protein
MLAPPSVMKSFSMGPFGLAHVVPPPHRLINTMAAFECIISMVHCDWSANNKMSSYSFCKDARWFVESAVASYNVEQVQCFSVHHDASTSWWSTRPVLSWQRSTQSCRMGGVASQPGLGPWVSAPAPGLPPPVAGPRWALRSHCRTVPPVCL